MDLICEYGEGSIGVQKPDTNIMVWYAWWWQFPLNSQCMESVHPSWCDHLWLFICATCSFLWVYSQLPCFPVQSSIILYRSEKLPIVITHQRPIIPHLGNPSYTTQSSGQAREVGVSCALNQKNKWQAAWAQLGYIYIFYINCVSSSLFITVFLRAHPGQWFSMAILFLW